MKLTTKGRYGLRVMLELALHHGGGPIAVETIVKKQNISGNYIHVLVTALRKAGLVRTTRGPNGGYELRQDPNQVTVFQVIQALEGEPSWGDCMEDDDNDSQASACVTRDFWCEVSQLVQGFLSSRTLADLAGEQRARQEAYLMYFI